MEVKLLNPEVLENLYKNHGEFACVCYDTPDKFAERVGKSCADNGHMSGSRCEYIKFKITGIDRGSAEQSLRHEIGINVPYEYQDNYTFSDYSELVKDVGSDKIIKNMASFRYIDKEGFEYAVPKNIKNCTEALHEYEKLMENINNSRTKIKKLLESCGIKPNLATQDANFVLPRATLSDFVIGFTPEALIHFCHKRLCYRSQEFIREVAIKMKKEISNVNPKFAKELVPHCQHLLWCPEGKKGCGLAPTKEELKLFLKESKN